MVSLLGWVAVFAVALAVLLKSAELFTRNASQVGLRYGLPSFVVGMTIVTVGTTLPEITTSVLATASGASEIAVGNVVGSNIANILLVLGAAGVVGRKITIDRDLVRIDLPLFVVSAGFLLLALLDGTFTVLEGLVGLGLLGIYFHFTLSEREQEDSELAEAVAEEIETSPVTAATYAVMAVSIALIVAAAYGLIESVTGIATGIGVPRGIVGLTAVAIGTSLPELGVAVIAARQGMPEIAVGNVLGANIYNALAVSGISSLAGTLTAPTSVMILGMPVMAVATLLYFFMTQDREMTRWEAGALVLVYALFLVNLAPMA